MKLAIRTSSGPYAIGLFDHDLNLLAQKSLGASEARQTTLGSLLQDCARISDRPIDEISEILVDLGPGGLSSTRAGVSFANALAYGMRVKLLGVSALWMQTYDARANYHAPILSMRPAPGGQSIWALFEGFDLTASGFSPPDEVIDDYRKRIGEFLVVGPMQRLNLKSDNGNNRLLDIESPSIESMLRSPKISPSPNIKAGYLEPINSADGA